MVVIVGRNTIKIALRNKIQTHVQCIVFDKTTS